MEHSLQALKAAKRVQLWAERIAECRGSGMSVRGAGKRQYRRRRITAAFALDNYGHVTERMKRDSAERMESFIKNVMGL